ncbi:uncharacterized protein LOC127868658 [Dreissena polymorpha]|uniref:FADD n=1 Tax=Dreissena polymorpha TaxID=45954 RepID=A0A9D4M776_DREPO|nr:uncharacterized protein LOC127868658 [Dreissena polymorpha]KAH3872045.1 hypothetical protein DPMN_035258 [Dreissena polymorpha]
MDESRARFNDTLLDLSRLIDDEDLLRMKFKSSGEVNIGKKQGEKITNPLHLFTALEERGHLGPHNTDYLKTLLINCCSGKTDGLRVLESYEQRRDTFANPYGNGYLPAQGYTAVPELAPQPQTVPASGPQVVYVIQGGVDQQINNFQQNLNRITSKRKDLDPEITFLTKSLGRDWKFYMRALGVHDDDIEQVSCDHTSLREKIHQCLSLWLEQQQQSASKYKLIEACRHSSVQRNDLATKLESNQL